MYNLTLNPQQKILKGGRNTPVRQQAGPSELAIQVYGIGFRGPQIFRGISALLVHCTLCLQLYRLGTQLRLNRLLGAS